MIRSYHNFLLHIFWRTLDFISGKESLVLLNEVKAPQASKPPRTASQLSRAAGLVIAAFMTADTRRQR